MSKKNKNRKNISVIEVEEVKIDSRIEKAIFCKRNSIITFSLINEDNSNEDIQFDVNYNAETDNYQIGYSPTHIDWFYNFMHRFAKEAQSGVIVIRTFLDEISHMVYTSEHGVAIPFKEIRMFTQIGGKIEPVDVVSLFQAMIIDNRTGKIDWNLVDKSEFFCDEELRYSMEELKSAFLEAMNVQ